MGRRIGLLFPLGVGIIFHDAGDTPELFMVWTGAITVLQHVLSIDARIAPFPKGDCNQHRSVGTGECYTLPKYCSSRWLLFKSTLRYDGPPPFPSSLSGSARHHVV
eukprot:754894-Hanusia_phi.AAC.1